jgi:DnaJ-class molecular chaperone
MSSDPQDGYVGVCVQCDGQMVEHIRSWGGDRTHITLACRECGEEGRVEWVPEEQTPTDNPHSRYGVHSLRHARITWVPCSYCEGHGDVPDPLCDVRRAMNGREHPCPECDATGNVVGSVEVV